MKLIALLSMIMVTSVHCSSESKCSCIPANMTLQIDATGGCTHAFDIGEDYGISDYYCIIRESKYQKNLIPISFNVIKLFELKGDLSTNGAATVIHGKSNGKNFDFVLNNYASTETPSGGIQFMLQGINSDGDTVTQDYIISFTNNCSSLVFGKGDRIGFLKVTAVNQPSEGMCPAAVQRASSSPALVYTMSDDSITEASSTGHLSDTWNGY